MGGFDRMVEKRRWTAKEEKFLRENYGKIPAPEIGKELDRSTKSVRRKAERLGLKSDFVPGEWSEDEVEFLRRKHGEMTAQQIADRLGRTEAAVWSRTRKLGLTSTWSQSEIKFLKENYEDLPYEEIAEELDRSPYSVRHKASRLGLIKGREGEKNPMHGRTHTAETKRKIIERGRPIEKPTSLERRLIEIVEEYGLPFKYVGDGQVILDGLNPDFIDCDGSKQIVEIFGDYWHSEEVTGCSPDEEEDRRKECFAEYGFDTLILWEHEIDRMSDSEIAERIRRFGSGQKGA